MPKPEVTSSDTKKSSTSKDFPAHGLLIDIAIQEKRLDDVVALYGEWKKSKRGDWFFQTDKQVAAAVANAHPQLALDIWRKVVDNLIGETKPRAYAEAATYLQLMHKVYKKTKRLNEWKAVLTELRTTHKAKRRLLEVLDTLTEKTLPSQG